MSITSEFVRSQLTTAITNLKLREQQLAEVERKIVERHDAVKAELREIRATTTKLQKDLGEPPTIARRVGPASIDRKPTEGTRGTTGATPKVVPLPTGQVRAIPRRTSDGPTVRSRILDVMLDPANAMGLATGILHLKVGKDVPYGSITGTLAALTNEGRIEKVGRGFYRAKRQEQTA